MKKFKASLDTIRKEAHGLITDIDSTFHSICKDRGIALMEPKPTPTVAEKAIPNQLDLIAAYERLFDIPTEDRLTMWFSTYGMTIFKPDLDPKVLEERTAQALDAMGLSAEEYAANRKYSNRNHVIVDMCRHSNLDIPDVTIKDLAGTDTFTIYQLKPGMWDYRFEGLEALTQRGLAVDPANYAEVYRVPLLPDETLQKIFTKFNNDRPKDFTGHSLSVSDVVVLERNGKATAHYVDLRDFAELASFVAPELSPEQNAPALASKALPSGWVAPEPPATDEPPDIPTNQQPIYKFSLETALQKDEVEAFHKSRALDAACGEAIDQAIIDNNYELHRYDLKAAARAVIAEYGADRVAWVLATTVQDQDWDGRLSNTNKAWAKGFDIPARPAHYLTTHLSVLDGFINRFREVEKEKPSLMGALAVGEQKSKQQFGQRPEPDKNTPTKKQSKGDPGL